MTDQTSQTGELKKFLIFYLFLIIMIKLFAGVMELQLTNPEPPSFEFTLGGIIFFVVGWGSYIFSFLFFSTNIWFINLILWATRIIIIIDIALYFKRLVNPLDN